MSLEDNIQKQQVDEEEIFYTPPSSPILNGQSTSTVSDISKLSFVTLNEAITAKSLSIAIKSETSLSRYYDSRVKARTFEAYVWDYKKVDHLNVREGESYPLFSPEWYALKRREFFKNIMMRHGDHCIECGVLTANSRERNLQAYKEPSTRRRRGPLCLGCHRLFNFPKNLNDEIGLIEYLLTGNLPPDEDVVRHVPVTEIISIFRRRTKQIYTRTTKRFGSNVSTVEYYQLMLLANKSDMRCAVTDCRTYIAPPDSNRYWALSYDHIIPLSKGNRSSSELDNLQVVCSIINCVKGNLSDKQVHDWWLRFKSAKSKKQY
ncbi:hypothetical protein CU097_005978 [Rhizopus azygosporus]|uniref:HNH nuclease domain-containing protein n=1 Tax=Rhizopus azygosporus TaxID=86630 RepID=A0A367K9L0_RHIAZ|nr:hypothetical protein CU097_005978 [Rhizopus azygosporus]